MRFRQKAEPKAPSPLAEMHLDNAPEDLDFKFSAVSTAIGTSDDPVRQPLPKRGNTEILPEIRAKELFLVNHAGGFLGASRT